MAFVLVGVVLLVLKLLALGPAALWSWWVVIAPFGLALAWWALSDQMGWTTRAAQRREQARQQRRREARMEALGMRPPRSSPGRPSQQDGNSRFGPASRSDRPTRPGADGR